MYRDDYAATHAQLEAAQRELANARSQGAQDQQRLAYLHGQIAMLQQALARSGMPMPTGYQLAPRHSTVLVLGILSLTVCSLMGPIAWVMGNEELRRMDSGITPPYGRGSAQAGRICGIVASSLLIMAAVILTCAVTLGGHRHY